MQSTEKFLFPLTEVQLKTSTPQNVFDLSTKHSPLHPYTVPYPSPRSYTYFLKHLFVVGLLYYNLNKGIFQELNYFKQYHLSTCVTNYNHQVLTCLWYRQISRHIAILYFYM